VKGQRVCGVSVFFGSRKQKCVSKSPTKADLVALSYYIGFIELFEEMIAFMLNMKCREPLVYQDNDLVIEMVTSGGGVTRTKKNAYKNVSCFRGGKQKVSGDIICWYKRHESRA
jgi:hypothetical protein